jgi:hypothetical protein
MGLFGKGNREKQADILKARERAEKAGRSWKNVLFGKKPNK